MSRFKMLFAAICLFFGFSGLAQADSLNGTSDNFQVSPSDQPSIYGMQFAKAGSRHHMDEMADTNVSLFDNSKMFFQVSTGYDFSFMGDIGTGTNNFLTYVKSLSGVTASGGENNSGILASALWGFRLDKSNSLALDLGSIINFGNNWTATDGTNTDIQNCSPVALSASLDYILDIAKSKGSRTYITAGAGYYHAIVTYSLTGPTDNFGGTFTGDTIGGTLGVGEELNLGGSFGLDLSVKGRYASFSKVSAGSATSFDGTGPSSLAMLSGVTAQPVLVPVTNAGIDGSGGTARYAVLDFSGIDAKVAMNFYF